MIRVSTTTLEDFRYAADTAWGDEQKLIASIRGLPFERTWQMQGGSAWHRAIEGQHPDATTGFPCPQDIPCSRFGDFVFGDADIDAAHEVLGPGVWELKATKVYPTQLGPVTVVAKIDHTRGLAVQENKTKFGSVEIEHYEQSLQWRYYLDVHGCACVRYNLWDFRPPKEGSSYCKLLDVVQSTFWPYGDLHAECTDWLERFLEWAVRKDLLRFLVPSGRGRTSAEEALR